MRWTVLVPVLLFPTLASADGPAVRLATSPARESVTLLLGTPPEALVRETRSVSLPAGETAFVLGWSGTKLVADSLHLAPVDDGAGIGVSGPVIMADEAQHACWTLAADGPIETELALSYLVRDLTWTPEYTVTLGPGRESLQLTAVAAVKNQSGENYEDARLDLGIGATLEADLEHNATLRIPYVSATDVPCQTEYVYNSEESPDTRLRVSLTNDAESNLGAAPLPAGKARVFEAAGDQELLLTEVRLPAVPIGATAEVILGTAREVSVERQVVKTQQVDVKKDVNGRLALWHQEDEIALTVESRKDDDVLLVITEKIPGEWRMLSNSHEFEQIDAEHIEFTVPVPAHGEVTVKYKARRMNLTP